jgi:hypothetical protein
MHLSSESGAVRFGDGSDVCPENTTPKTSTSRENGEYRRSNSQKDRLILDVNEITINSTHGRTYEEALDAILAAWTILLKRYQSDAFHHFTWSVGDTGGDNSQTLSTTELALFEHKSAGSLKTKLSGVRSKHLAASQPTVIILNDGTELEVCVSWRHLN